MVIIHLLLDKKCGHAYKGERKRKKKEGIRNVGLIKTTDGEDK